MTDLTPWSLPIPHSGYHWDGRSGRFFEGWYYRVTLPALHESFAFMYSIEDPSDQQLHSGGAVQVLGPQDSYLCRTFPAVKGFWADRNRLALGHWGKTQVSGSPRWLDPGVFEHHVYEGYQATATHNQGQVWDPRSGKIVRWHYQIQPVQSWGDRRSVLKATGGWLSLLPLYEPGWQVLMAYGLASGWIEWQGDRHEFAQAPAYCEKNWGRSFPTGWFWIQCNCFRDEPDLALTAAAGERRLLHWHETPGLVGIHHQGRFYEFAPWNAQIFWDVHPWGSWRVSAQNSHHQVELVGSTDRPGTWVRTPTAQGLIYHCRDTTLGHLTLTLQQRGSNKPLLQAESHLCGLEVGGDWNSPRSS